MEDREYVGKDFIWFFGVVESRDDPLQIGRVQVRCHYWHTEDKSVLPTSQLPWAQCVQPITSAAVSGIGKAALGLVEGSLVMGFFMDGKYAQRPMILGSIAGIPTQAADPTKGFNDPNGVYPTILGEPDIGRLSVNKNETLSATKNDARSLGISKGNSTETWNEPASAYAARYGNNHVMSTESGHVQEFDDTPGNERIHEYHKAGTFYEIDSNGNKITRIVGNEYEITLQDRNVYIKGSCNITIDSNATTHIKGDWNIQVDGNKTENVAGTYNQTVTGKGRANWNGSGSDIVVNNGSSDIGLTTHTHTDPAGIAGSESSSANDS
jgi:hypothetical protein